MPVPVQPHRRGFPAARVFVSEIARRISDYAAAIVPLHSTDAAVPGEALTMARRAKLQVAELTFAAVCCEMQIQRQLGRSDSAAWAEVAAYAGHGANIDWFVRQYRDDYERWVEGADGGRAPGWMTTFAPALDVDDPRLAADLERWVAGRTPSPQT